jgi:type I restriction enzyme, S subunit
MSSKAGKGPVPKLRFPDFQNAQGWTETTLGKVAAFEKGKGISKAEISPKGVQPCIRYGELYTRYNETIHAVISYTNVPSDELVLSQANDVVIPASGETEIDIATASCVLKSGIALGGDLNIIRSKMNGVFLSYYLNNAKKQSIAKLAQGISVVHLYAKQLKTLAIDVPENSEQKKIADCLSSLDDLIAAQAHQIEALKAHKQSLMQQLFPAEGETVPRLRFPEFRGAGAWEEKKAEKLFANRVEKGEAGLPIYSVTINDGMIKRSSLDRDFDDIAEPEGNKKAHSHDIAYNMMRMWQGASGVALEDCMVSPAYIVLAPRKEVNSIFFGYLFKLPQYLQKLTSHSHGLTLDRLRLYYKNFAEIPLLYPSIREQKRIAGCLFSIDELIGVHIKKREALKAQKEGLMQGLFPSTAEGEA